MTRVAITSTQISIGYIISQKYLSILVSHPDTTGIQLPVYFFGICNFNPPILASWGIVGVDVAITSNAGQASPTIPIVMVWIEMLGIAMHDHSIGGS